MRNLLLRLYLPALWVGDNILVLRLVLLSRWCVFVLLDARGRVCGGQELVVGSLNRLAVVDRAFIVRLVRGTL